MLVIFRTDSSSQIGLGHVMRCLTLAETLRNRGDEVIFICREHENNYCELVESQGFKIERLPHIPLDEIDITDDYTSTYASWLGATWQKDAEQTIKFIKVLEKKPDWIVVDHYALDYRWEGALRDMSKKIMVIDDIADRNHDCDLLLDQNLINNMHTRYNDILSIDCIRLLGPDYAIMQSDYAKFHNRIPLRSGPIKRLLIHFGAADTDNITGKCIDAFLKCDRNDIRVDVIISGNMQHKNTINQQIKNFDNINLYSGINNLAPLISKADLSIGASGATSWERCCLGLPALVISSADNQRSIAEGLHSHELVKWLGHRNEVSSGKIKDSLSKILKLGLDQSWSQKCRDMVDGNGVNRVCDIMRANTDICLKIRRASVSDRRLIASWSNMLSKDEVSVTNTSTEWFDKGLRDFESDAIYILETLETTPMACVYFRKNSGTYTLYCILSPAFMKTETKIKVLTNALLMFRTEQFGEIVLNRVYIDTVHTINKYIIEDDPVSVQSGLSISLCTDSDSWFNDYIPTLAFSLLEMGHVVSWAHKPNDLSGGDVCFFLSYEKVVNKEQLGKFKNNLVVHESNLPKGRGWSPMTWQILEGAEQIPVILFEADKSVDSGPIYLQENIFLKGDELVNDWKFLQAEATVKLCRDFVKKYPEILDKARMQSGDANYFPRRNSEDSRLDIDKTLQDQFSLLRVVDNDRYPAWFEIEDRRFELKIFKQ